MYSKSCIVVFVGLNTFEHFSILFPYFLFSVRGNHSYRSDKTARNCASYGSQKWNPILLIEGNTRQ